MAIDQGESTYLDHPAQDIDDTIEAVKALQASTFVHDSVQVNLADVTWTRSGGGMYYSSTVQMENISKLYCVCLSGFANLRETDMITPACRRSGSWSGFALYANTNSFESGAWVTVSGIGEKSGGST